MTIISISRTTPIAFSLLASSAFAQAPTVSESAQTRVYAAGILASDSGFSRVEYRANPTDGAIAGRLVLRELRQPIQAAELSSNRILWQPESAFSPALKGRISITAIPGNAWIAAAAADGPLGGLCIQLFAGSMGSPGPKNGSNGEGTADERVARITSVRLGNLRSDLEPQGRVVAGAQMPNLIQFQDRIVLIGATGPVLQENVPQGMPNVSPHIWVHVDGEQSDLWKNISQNSGQVMATQITTGRNPRVAVGTSSITIAVWGGPSVETMDAYPVQVLQSADLINWKRLHETPSIERVSGRFAITESENCIWLASQSIDSKREIRVQCFDGQRWFLQSTIEIPPTEEIMTLVPLELFAEPSGKITVLWASASGDIRTHLISR